MIEATPGFAKYYNSFAESRRYVTLGVSRTILNTSALAHNRTFFSLVEIEVTHP
jgi:hypothetical protein